jgi:hypothetical protein
MVPVFDWPATVRSLGQNFILDGANGPDTSEMSKSSRLLSFDRASIGYRPINASLSIGSTFLARVRVPTSRASCSWSVIAGAGG